MAQADAMLAGYPVEVMTAGSVTTLPGPQRVRHWAYEPKFDGFWCVAFCTGGTVQMPQQRHTTTAQGSHPSRELTEVISFGQGGPV